MEEMSQAERDFINSKTCWGGVYHNGYIHYDTFHGRVSAKLGNPSKKKKWPRRN